MANLKDNLVENIGTLVKIVERGNVSDSKFGGKTHWHKIALNGQIFDHAASDAEMKALGLLNVGEEVQAVKKKNNYGTFSIFWSPKDGAEARMNANPQPMSNTATVRQDKQIAAYNDEKEEKSIAISLQGFMQQIMPVVLTSCGSNIKDEKDGYALVITVALDLAVLAREACLRKAKEIHLGIEDMKHDPITAADALSAFAPDPTSTL